MDKREFIERVNSERTSWDELLAQVPDDRMPEPGVEGDWSTKDVLAHVTWYEREMVGMLKSRTLIGSDWWALPLEDRNTAVHDEIMRMSLEEVRARLPGCSRPLSISWSCCRKRHSMTLRISRVCGRMGALGRHREQHIQTLSGAH